MCWLNSVERNRFSAPYEAKDCDAKFAFFLPRFAAVLANPETVWQVRPAVWPPVAWRLGWAGCKRVLYVGSGNVRARLAHAGSMCG